MYTIDGCSLSSRLLWVPRVVYPDNTTYDVSYNMKCRHSLLSGLLFSYLSFKFVTSSASRLFTSTWIYSQVTMTPNISFLGVRLVRFEHISNALYVFQISKRNIPRTRLTRISIRERLFRKCSIQPQDQFLWRPIQYIYSSGFHQSF